jgi:hypothetical protein
MYLAIITYVVNLNRNEAANSINQVIVCPKTRTCSTVMWQDTHLYSVLEK